MTHDFRRTGELKDIAGYPACLDIVATLLGSFDETASNASTLGALDAA
jgi:hypothetical protein